MKDIREYSFPEDIRSMSEEELNDLAYDIRGFLVEKVSKTGGHLASNLGAVELTISLHKTFDCFKDKLIWDVGHQTYVHKILTGRADQFDNLRQSGGMSGFPKHNESPADIFDTGHASNSISLATGLIAARDLDGEDYNVISIIGDGSLTGGMAFEGLNNLGSMNSKAIVVVNDNGMSISRSTGGLAAHLGKLRLSDSYVHAKSTVRTALNKVPVLGTGLAHGISNVKNTVKYMLVDNGALFEAFGFKYIGPIDGHDIRALCDTFEAAKEYDEPVLIHVVTKKGKGYQYAEEEPGRFHGIGKFDADTGKSDSKGESWSSVFGRCLTEKAISDDRICAVYAAMEDGTGLRVFAETFPERSFDVGIAEEHAVSFAAGLAKGGKRPFVTIYSTFLQRAYDQIIEDVCLQNLPVTFAIDRAGCVGADGETHHGIFDLSYLSHMPGMTVLAPKDFRELEAMIEYSLTLDGPCAIRYPRGSQVEFSDEFNEYSIETGKAQKLITGSDVEIWACGNMTSTAVEVFSFLADKGIKAGVVNARFVKPLDTEMLAQSDESIPLIVTLEDNVIDGGFGEKVSAFCCRADVMNIGWPDKFIEHGNQKELMKEYGMDAGSIAERIMERLER